MQARLSQQGGVLQRSEDRRELRVGRSFVHHCAAILDREAAQERQLQEQLEEVAEEEEVWGQQRQLVEQKEVEGEGEGGQQGPGEVVGGETHTYAHCETRAGLH